MHHSGNYIDRKIFFVYMLGVNQRDAKDFTLTFVQFDKALRFVKNGPPSSISFPFSSKFWAINAKCNFNLSYLSEPTEKF